MKLAIINLTAGGISGGHKNYIYNMLPRLAASDKVEKILCASPVSFKAEEWIPASPKVTLALCEPFSFIRPAPDRKLKPALDLFKPDLIFVSMERHLNYSGVPVVTLVHNMAPLVPIPTAAGILEKIKSLGRRFETGLAVSRASALIAPTAFVSDALVARLGVEAEKVSVIPFGHAPVPVTVTPPDSTLDLVKNGFIFTAGTFEIYRGFEDLVRAFAEIKRAFPGLKLVVAGGARPATSAYRSKMAALAETLGVSSDVVWLGNIPQEELSWFYSNCSAFALTSRVESFCFIAVEAMAHGCNSVATDSPCLPEIMGDTSLYYKAGDTVNLEKILAEILRRRKDEREHFSQRAKARSAKFSWDSATTQTLALFDRIIENRHGVR
jgi:glycosyltransferase involved in cell wall biosynthesis